MRFARFSWQPKLLALGIVAYEAVVLVLTFGAPIIAAWRVTRPDAGHGQIVASLNNVVLQFSMTSTSEPGWTGSYDLGVVALWLLLPPLIVWFLWQSRRSRLVQAAVAPAMSVSDAGANALRERPFGDTVIPFETIQRTTQDGAA